MVQLVIALDRSGQTDKSTKQNSGLRGGGDREGAGDGGDNYLVGGGFMAGQSRGHDAPDIPVPETSTPWKSYLA